ncbi:hypothetical protein HMI54_015680 [Coelomomyces lativittatus]|nr:hypothetical protein HMI54_015680 [Coelomomyces lativittatus]
MATTQLYDGAGFRPHFTLRTLTRALTFATDMVSRFGVRRALFEGLSLTFLTLLDLPSHAQLMTTLHRCILKDRPSQYLNVPVTPPTHPENFVRLDAYWLKKGNHHLQFNHNNKKKAPYILSASVKKNLIHLARSVMTQRYPVLIQGPTSSGKTSMIEYLAHLTGHTFVRVNNHAHTDLQEYLGCYVSNDQGQLIFKEGTLVTALRQGHWIVLDELNLAPTDVLEALNRLLDENRELFIPETQTWVHPHPSFMLFATQNPPSYGGRKLLSRAFRNRFLELHFDDLPDTELLQILSQRCALPPSYAKKMVQVYQTLRTRRQTSRIFDGKSSFITLRDLFRWADRRPSSYDELAIHGFMILGERVRQMEERQFILEVLQEVFKVQVDPVKFYASIFKAHAQALETSSFAHTVVWNESMQRLFALAYICQQHGEPVLLVGETGCGKTTVCQLISHLHKKSLTMVNCHQFSETSDFLGSQRPCRHVDEQSPLFEWQDGPLVVAMKQGHDFLLDEISLADDSVLERLNSLLEPSRTLLLAEKGGDAEHVVAHPDFRFFATMNPGGDYGKKELSPALRNRFTEIWTPPISSHQDRWSILHAHLKNKLPSALPMDISHTSLTSMEDVPSQLATRILEFIVWYEQTCEQHHHVNTLVSIRDLISWCQFVSATYPTWLHENAAIYHGACLVLLDGLKHPSLKEKALLELKQRTQYNDFFIDDLLIINNPTHFGIEPFLLTKVSSLSSSTATTTTVTTTMLTTSSISPSTTTLCKHSFHAPTAKLNLFRLLRAIFTTDKAILLEGSPGVGKTSVVSSLADILGQTLVRINLSEQTDLVDLFGSDLPVEGGEAGAFSWRDGLFLSAMKRGDWVLLDELNLASQSVLEGLNACLDHRGTVYIPELNQSFAKHPNFRVFGAQNPMEEGGGRRGLPKSFLNRFSCIHLEPLSTSDYFFILKTMFPTCNVTDEELHQMIQFNASMHQNTMVERNFGLIGAPWEFNLRDLIRWLELKSKYPSCSISSFLHLLYFHRLQTKQDIEFATQLWLEISNEPRLSIEKTSLDLVVTPLSVRLGLVDFPRSNGSDSQNLPLNELSIPNSMLSPLHSLLHCLDMGWMVMLNGPSESGKTYLARTAASLCGRSLVEFSVHKSVDAMELLGGFEQIDANRCWEELVRQLRKRTSILLPVLLKLGTLPSETQVLASYTQRSFPLGSLKLMELWIKQLHDISRLLSLPDSHELHVNLLNKYKKVQLDVTGKFEWVDGIVLEAIQTGQWLLLENANLCSPSVLDRLNPLFESNFNRRQLVMNERGMTKSGDFMVIEPHPEFRLIMTMNPIHGHISRALRNRGIEISLLPGQWVQDKRILRHVMVSNGIIDTTLQENLLAIITSSATSTPTTTTSPRQSVLSIAYAADLLQRGFPNDMVMRHRLLCSTSSNTQVTSIHLLNEETKNSNALFAPLHFPLHLQDSMASLMATKFSFVDSPVDKFFDEKFLQPALDWILFHPTSFSFCSNMVSWLEWREKQTIPSHFSILTFKHILIRLHSILLRTSFSTPLFVKSFLDYVKFLFLQEQATSNIKTLQPKFFNSIQRSFSSHFLPDYVLVPKPSQTEILLIPLLTSFDKSMMQSLHQVFDKHRTLELLFWTKSMFQKCFLDASLNLDLLDAHVTHLLKLTEHSDLFAPYHNALNTLQASYFGDMDVTRHIWARFHPWVVRSFALLEPVNQLESLPISQVTCQLLELISDALFNMYLGDVEHQIFLESDFPRLLKLVQTSGLITSIAENLDSEKHLVPNSLTTLKDQFTQMDHKYSQKSKLWLRAILLFNYLPQFLTDANIAVTFPTCLFASSPTIKSYVSMKLMQWSITHQNSIERSWNQIYFEFQNIIMDHSLWRAYPKELSVELCERSKKESILGLEILQKQMSNLTTLYYENFHHLEADLFVKEKSLLKTRLQMLSHFQIPLEVQNHLFQVESLMRHHTNLICLSEAWMHMGLAFVKLATPTLPLDPASRFKLSHENALEWQAKLKLELEAFELLQYRDNNKHKNDITDWITEKLPEIKKLILESGRQLYLRPENAASHLNALFSSIRNLFSMLFDPKSLLISFKSMTSMGSFQEQLIVTRQSFISFIENSRKNFSLFMDMLEPIYTGIYDIFHGFNLLSVHDHHQPLTAKEEILQTLPWMKPGCFYALLEKHLNFENDEETIDICTILLENLATYQYLNPFFKINPSLIFKLLNPLIAKFSLMKEKEAIEKKESMKSFKYASSLSVQILDDESDKEWLDIENDSEHLTSLEQSISYVGNNAFMSTELNESLHESRSNLFIADCTVSKKKLNDWMNRSFFAFQNFFGNIKFENAVQEAHCREGIPKFSNSTLHHLLSLIKCSSAFSKDVDPVAYDFYRSPNLPEVLRLVPILTKLDFKIKTLLEDWPEHDVLQQILTIVYRISTFPSHLPLRKFLESLEILLGKCDEWQKYASSSVSLKESIQEISSLIVHWRKLEMKNWRSLLDWYDLEKIKEGATLWLHLLSLLSFVEGVTESELILSLDEYFMGSTLGQFPLRIQILSSLTSHFNIPVIDNVLHYYSEFLPFVQSALNNGRTLIESELKDFVKIAGWHDVNVYSLKVSAQKNRKQLKKCLKKYKELLGRPLAPMLKEKGTIYFAEQRTILKEKTSCKASNLAISMYPEHILHLFNESCTDWIQFKDAQLDRIFMKSTTLIKRHISLPNTLESISNDVIEQIVAFKSETDKITDPITKQESSFLLQCRKKAFSDFLKRFKEMGLVWHHSVPVEVSTLMASPHVPSSNSFSFNSLLNSSKAYRSRVASYLPFIIVNKSPDLEPRQAERLLGYVMDLLKHTLAESSYLAPVCKHLIDVQNLIQTWTSHGNLSFISKEWVESKTFFSLQTDLTSLIAYIKQLLTLNTVSLNSKRYLEALNSKLLKYFGLWNVNVQSHFSMKYFSGTLFKAWENEKKNIIHEIQNTLCLSSRDALFMQPILETLSHPFEKIALSLETHLEFLFFEELEKFIEMIMIQIQHLYAFNGLNYGLTFKSLHSDILSLLSKLNLNFVEKFFDVYFSKLSPELQHHLSRRLLPLLQNYANYLHDTLHEIFVHQKSLSKCTYVLCTNAFRLIQKGYCVPFNTNESQEENDDISGQGLEGADGTGIGQGEGKKDVSNEIENEGQIEGLMGEEEYQPENFKENQNDEGIEMEQDFQGKLEDLKLDGGERNSQNENDDSNLESEDEVEEMDMMNQVDSPESHQVDPTLWDEESDDEKEMREAENIEPSPVHRNPHEVETLEDSQNLEVEPLSKEAPTSDNMEGHLDEEHNLATEDIDKTPDENVGDKENTDENEGKENDEDMDTSKTDADMNLRDEAIKRPQESTESEINLEEMGDEPLDFEEDIKDQDDFDKSESDVVNDDVDMEANSIHEDSDHEAELNPNDDSVLDTDKENKNESEEKLESPAKNANVKQDDVYGTEKKDVNGDEAPLEKEEVENEEKNCQTEQQSTVAGHSSLNKGEDDAIDRTTEMADHQGPSQQNVNDSKCVNSEMQPPQPDNTSKPSDITPSLVEDIKAWKRRLKIAEQTLLSEDPNVQNMENDSPYEKEYTYLQDDDQEMEGDEQTLSAAEPNQTRELPFSLEKEVEEKDTTYQESMTVPPGLGAQEKSSPPNNSSGGSLAPEDEMKVQMFARPHIQEPLSLEEEQECRRKLLDQVEVWRDQNRDVTSSMELWHGCKNLTLLYATQLTEQLRLLLEPTLASHLTGDYKSGKRLNMRRILPYIASDFRKDKIWLRRTKANQRDYQVLIAVDDSQSMNDSSAIQLAFESVCLITRAMEQLEVGPIALCSFGEDLKVVHPFGQRFTDDAGAQAFQRFQFNQSRTNIEALLQSSLHLFQETNSQNIPWRLMLILSDGICDHHEKLRHLVRKAAEARILTVCIVLDQREESILQMSSVNFDNGQLRMTHYMDNFPFDFYVVLRDIRRLPMVLSDALRQFFTLSTST